MSDFDNAPYSGNGTGGEGGGPEIRSMPFFPAPPGRSAPAPQGVPLGAPTPLPPAPQSTASPDGRHTQLTTAPADQPAEGEEAVPGRIRIEDQVVEKIVLLAAQEVAGVAGLAADGIKVRTGETDLTLDLTLVVEYGSVMMEVARNTRDNVGRIVGRMLGLRISAVNVTVGDVWMPGVPEPTR